MDKQETITIEDNHSFPAFTPNIGINQPNSIFTRCGKRSDGKMGCLVLSESYEAYEENTFWADTDNECNRLIRLAWKECGIDDYYFKRETLTFE